MGCTTDTQPLYPTFMGRLSARLVEWDAQELSLLWQAKREQLSLEGVPYITDRLVDSEINRKELSQYCCRRRRGGEVTMRLIEQLLHNHGRKWELSHGGPTASSDEQVGWCLY